MALFFGDSYELGQMVSIFHTAVASHKKLHLFSYRNNGLNSVLLTPGA